jgi:hypothetical protein
MKDGIFISSSVRQHEGHHEALMDIGNRANHPVMNQKERWDRKRRDTGRRVRNLRERQMD